MGRQEYFLQALAQPRDEADGEAGGPIPGSLSSAALSVAPTPFPLSPLEHQINTQYGTSVFFTPLHFSPFLLCFVDVRGFG